LEGKKKKMEWYYFYALFLSCFLTNGMLHFCKDKYTPEKRFYKCDRGFLMNQYKRFCPQIVFNLCLLAPFTQITMHWFGDFESSLCTWMHFLLEQLFFAFWFETFFYFSHALLHWGPLMNHIHYKHHQMVHSIGLGAVYCHPVEMLVSNYLPFALPILLYHHLHWVWPLSLFATWCGIPLGKSHVESVVFWTMLAGIYIIFSHNGYPFPHSYPKHLVHHKTKRGNFGTLGLWDWVCGTDSD
jgi:sterol desaturase/sphingolipid hydroxylase (fatty acid hydroxylase superfamily)